MARLVIYKDFLKSGRGADRATATLANTMVQCGYEVHVITQQKATEPLSVTFDPAITCHALPMRKRPIARLLNKWLLSSAVGEQLLARLFPSLDLVRQHSLALQRLVREIQPDVVVVAGSNECVDLLLAGPVPMPVVMMFHVYPPECFRKNKYRRASRLKAVLPWVSECQVLLPSHRETLGMYTTAPVTAIGNGINWPVDEPLPAFASREKQIVYVAYFTKDKNHLQLLQAFAQLQAPEWTLELYGSGSPEWETRLRSAAAELGIADRVHFMGVTHLPKPILLRSGICAFPSKVEGFGLALAEAMWCGLPCVGFKDAPGVSELLSHEANGLLVEPTVEAVAAALQRLIEDAGLREQLGSIAAKTARRTFSQATNVQQWDDLFQRQLQKSHTQNPLQAAEETVKTVDSTPSNP